MFQRLTTAANGLFENTAEVFKYELSSVPSSMFDCNRLPREACKSNLADAIWACGSDCTHEIDGEGFQYVLDGGSLLQRIPWTHGDSFGSIAQMYVDHVIKKYKDPVIAFDSYPELPAIKEITHLRRTKGIVSPNINFTPTMPFKTKKELFMSNSHNKQAFINMLCEKLNEHDIRYKNAVDDADLLIAKTAVCCVLSSEVIVIVEDTDLLVLLIHHVNQQCKWVIFKSDKMAKNKKMKIWNVQQTKGFLEEDICHLLPFLHSLTGCDSTSRLFGIGKGIALKRLNQEYLKAQGQLFMNTTYITIFRENVSKAGNDSLNENSHWVRYKGINCKPVLLLFANYLCCALFFFQHY
jgi:hypothetical protein